MPLGDDLSGLAALSPPEANLYWHHLGNLYGPGKVVSPGGDISTLYQAPVEGPGGRYYNIPTVWGGQILTLPEARQRAAAMGWQNWPSYPTPEAADLAYEARVHPLATRDVSQWNGPFNPFMSSPFRP